MDKVRISGQYYSTFTEKKSRCVLRGSPIHYGTVLQGILDRVLQSDNRATRNQLPYETALHDTVMYNSTVLYCNWGSPLYCTKLIDEASTPHSTRSAFAK